MKEHRITIDIDTTGALSADAEGFTNGACIKELEELLKGLASTSDNSVTRKNDGGGSMQNRNTISVSQGRKP